MKSAFFNRQAGHRSNCTHQWATTKAVDQEPRNKRSQEEPCIEETSHETRSIGVEAETVLEQCAGVICTIVRIEQARKRSSSNLQIKALMPPSCWKI